MRHRAIRLKITDRMLAIIGRTRDKLVDGVLAITGIIERQHINGDIPAIDRREISICDIPGEQECRIIGNNGRR